MNLAYDLPTYLRHVIRTQDVVYLKLVTQAAIFLEA